VTSVWQRLCTAREPRDPEVVLTGVEVADLLDGRHPLSDLFFAGHAVISQLREIHQASAGDETGR